MLILTPNLDVGVGMFFLNSLHYSRQFFSRLLAHEGQPLDAQAGDS
jgi:hypothetical protein